MLSYNDFSNLQLKPTWFEKLLSYNEIVNVRSILIKVLYVLTVALNKNIKHLIKLIKSTQFTSQSRIFPRIFFFNSIKQSESILQFPQNLN